MATIISVDKSKDGISQCINGMLQARNGRELLRNGIGIMQTMIDGDGSQVADYGTMATRCGYSDAATAQASWNEITALFNKLNTDASVIEVLSATNQCCAKHGV